MITGGDVESAAIPVEREIPDVFGLWIEEDAGLIALINRHFALGRYFRSGCACLLSAGRRCGPWLFRASLRDFIDLTVGRGRGIKRTLFVDLERLNLQFLCFKDDAGFSVGSHPIDSCW